MKIVIIPPGTKTGEGTYGEFLINGLIKRGFEHELLNNPVFANRPNIKIFLGSLLLKKILSEKDVSIVHNLDNLGPFLIKHNLKGVKLIQNVFDIAPLILPEIHSPIIKFNFNYTLPRMIKNCDHIIVSSDSTKRDLKSIFGTNEDKIDVIHPGIDTSFFHPMIQKGILSKYGINKNYLIYVGGDNPRKNLNNLILAYNEIFREIDHDLVLVGPINKIKIKKIIKDLNEGVDIMDRIILPGYVDHNDLPCLYSSATALVFPSLYEGFGFPPLEAMACGTPVIVSNNSSLPEVVGSAGVYIENPLDPSEIVRSILKVIEDENLAVKLKKHGFKQVNKFSWNQTIEKTCALYQRIGI